MRTPRRQATLTLRALLSAPLLLGAWLARGPADLRHVNRQHAPRVVAVDVTVPTTTAPTTTVPPTTTTTAPVWVDPVTPTERAEWDKVNMCEEHGNWHVRGTYSGGLGISEANWYAYGGQRDFGDEWAASPDQQIVVAMRMQRYPPDQNGCTGAW